MRTEKRKWMILPVLMICGTMSLATSSLMAQEAENSAKTKTSSKKPVQVYILAGQSNMQGYGLISSASNGGRGALDWYVKNDPDKKFTHIVDA